MTVGIDARLWSQTGVGRYIRNLVKNLANIDNKNSYVLFVREEEREEIENLVGKKWRTVIVNVPWHSLSEQVSFSRILTKENLDLMHFPYFSAPINYNKPFVITIHDLILHHFPTGQSSTLPYLLYRVKLEGYKFLIKRLALKSEKILTPSQSAKKEVVSHLGVLENKVVVTPEGSGLNSTSTKRLIEDDYFLYVGNAYPHKNLEMLLSAFQLIEGAKLVLVGKKDYFYKRLQSQNSNTNVIFYNEAKDSELSNLYENAVALVVPSLMEGFGLPVLEAMSLKTPVIASDIPSFMELLGEDGVYFDPRNKEELVEKLKGVLSGTIKTEKKVQNSFEKSKEYSWEKMARETLKVYESSTGL